MKLSNYSLSYASQFTQGQMDVFKFLSLCRELGVEGASLHVRHLASTEPDYLKQVRRAYLDKGLSVSHVHRLDQLRPAAGASTRRSSRRPARRSAWPCSSGAPLLRVFAGSPPSEAERGQAFDRAAAAVRRLCEEAAKEGLPIGLQNHNHGALCRHRRRGASASSRRSITRT